MRFTRRSLLVASSGLALPAFGGHLRNGEILPDPSFEVPRKKHPFAVGVRPHRLGGVRLELEAAPVETPTGKKYLLHNYGHGGGGITLSWGCASVVKDLVASLLQRLEQKEKTPVAIVGTGVIGLTVASELRRAWPSLPLTVYAKDLDVSTTTSFIAGGQFEPSIISNEYQTKAQRAVLADYLRRAKVRVVELQNSGKRQLYGVAERKNYTLDHQVKAFDLATPTDVVPAPRKGTLPFAKLNQPGREYSTWLMNPMYLLPRLVQDLTEQQVRFVQRTFVERADVFALPESVLINCTGLGAKALFSDDKVVPQRGQLVALEKTNDKQFYFFSGGCENRVISYAFCRQDDVVIGGTIQPGNETTTIVPGDDAAFTRLLDNSRRLFGGEPASCLKEPALADP